MQIDALPTFKKTNRKVPGGAQPRALEHRAHIKPLTSCPLPAVPLQPALLKATYFLKLALARYNTSREVKPPELQEPLFARDSWFRLTLPR